MKYSIALYSLKLWLITGMVSYWLCAALFSLIYKPVNITFQSQLDAFATSMEYSVGFLLFTMLFVWIIKEAEASSLTKKIILIIVGAPLGLSTDIQRELLREISQVPLIFFVFSAAIYTIVFASGVMYYKFPAKSGKKRREALIKPINAKMVHHL